MLEHSSSLLATPLSCSHCINFYSPSLSSLQIRNTSNQHRAEAAIGNVLDDVGDVGAGEDDEVAMAAAAAAAAVDASDSMAVVVDQAVSCWLFCSSYHCGCVDVSIRKKEK